jgi:hypothetical protein
MAGKSLPEACFDVLAGEVALQRVPGMEDIEQVPLLNGEDGGGIRMYAADRIGKVALVELSLGRGVPVPHHDNRLCAGCELFIVVPDYSYKMPAWGINNVIMQDGAYYFDTDFSFGWDLVTDYEYVKRYVAPFNETYQRFAQHPDFTMVSFYESTPWVRTYISPLFFSAITRTDRAQTVFDLAAELIRLWARMFREAEPLDAAGKEAQEQRLRARNAGSKDSDRMGRVLLEAYGRETFGKFFKAMT